MNLIEKININELYNFIDKYQQYKEFFSENLDKNKFTTETIQKILNYSEYIIRNSENNNFQAYYKEENIDGINYKEFDYNYMIYLRDRALTRNKISDQVFMKKEEGSKEFYENLKKEQEKINQNNILFVSYVHQINKLFDILNKITKKGFYFPVSKDEEKKDNNYNFFRELENKTNPLLFIIKIKIEKKDYSYYCKYYFC